MPHSKSEASRLLEQWSQGDPEALDKLMPLVYDELRQIARKHLAREAPGHSLQPTAVVNEACLHLLERHKVDWKHRAQFFGHVSEVMRRILVDHARKRQAARRGGGATRVSFDEAIGLPAKWNRDLVAVDDAVKGLEALDPRQSRIVRLKPPASRSYAFAEQVELIDRPVSASQRKAGHPIAYGYPEVTSAFRTLLPVYGVRRADRGRVVLQWGTRPPAVERDEDDEDDGAVKLLVSGGLEGGEALEGRPTILDVRVGQGRVVAYNFNPIHRDLNHSDHRFFWNAILNWSYLREMN